MTMQLNFLGLAISSGQSHVGTSQASDEIKTYFSVLNKFGIELHDRGSIAQSTFDNHKIYSSSDLIKFNWIDYKRAKEKIVSLLHEPKTLINWGGDHSVALSTVSAFCEHYPEGNVLWVDAHADLNLPESSPSGNLHGMPLSILLNLNEIGSKNFPWIKTFLKPSQLIYLGIRDLDPFEQEALYSLNIKHYTTKTSQINGIQKIAEEILAHCNNDPLHVSFDIDCLSPEFAPATGLNVADGLSADDIEILGSTLSKHKALKSIDVVEINPLIGTHQDVFKTNVTALKLINSIFSPMLKPQGGIYDRNCRTAQEQNSTQMEPSPQV
jgi:arginase